jgi:hypothetical protein
MGNEAPSSPDDSAVLPREQFVKLAVSLQAHKIVITTDMAIADKYLRYGSASRHGVHLGQSRGAFVNHDFAHADNALALQELVGANTERAGPRAVHRYIRH